MVSVGSSEKEREPAHLLRQSRFELHWFRRHIESEVTIEEEQKRKRTDNANQARSGLDQMSNPDIGCRERNEHIDDGDDDEKRGVQSSRAWKRGTG